MLKLLFYSGFTYLFYRIFLKPIFTQQQQVRQDNVGNSKHKANTDKAPDMSKFDVEDGEFKDID